MTTDFNRPLDIYDLHDINDLHIMFDINHIYKNVIIWICPLMYFILLAYLTSGQFDNYFERKRLINKFYITMHVITFVSTLSAMYFGVYYNIIQFNVFAGIITTIYFLKIIITLF